MKELSLVTALPAHLVPTTGQPSALLAELRDAHELLLESMSALDKLTRGPLPSKAEVIDARWRISRRSLRRRGLWNRIFQHLSEQVSPIDLADLRRLREADMVLLSASSEHVSRWTIDAVMQEWPEYCGASRAIRWKMQAAVGAEKRLLYPMLQTHCVPRP